MALTGTLGLNDHDDGGLAVGIEGPGAVGDALMLGCPDRAGGSGPQGVPVDDAEIEPLGQQLGDIVGKDGAGEDALVSPIMGCHMSAPYDFYKNVRNSNYLTMVWKYKCWAQKFCNGRSPHGSPADTVYG